MICTYIRSSAIGTKRLCEQQYFLSYVLGIPQIPNHKAEMGTVVHKVMECLALEKLAQQNNQKNYQDDSLGKFPVGTSPEHLCDMSFNHYSIKSPNDWTDDDRRKCQEWTKKALNFDNGSVDPRNRNIFAVEKHFDFEINEPWATYDFNYQGEPIQGKLSLKGTVDLITQLDETTLEVLDWKTGRRWDWATDEIKTYKKLNEDFQLRMYHYALSKLFPNFKTILISIYFINGFWNGSKKDPKNWIPGGLYTLAFSKYDIPEFERRLEKQYKEIISCRNPQLTVSWKCNSFCHYGKTNYPGSNLSICEFIRRRTEEQGIDKVVELYTDPQHNIGIYNAPGE